MIQSTQRKMLRLITQTKRKYKTIVKRKDETNEEKDTDDLSGTGDESEDGQSSSTHNDQDSDVSIEYELMRKLTLQRLKKRTGLNTIKEAQTMPWKR